jgi:hypothetical protein
VAKQQKSRHDDVNISGTILRYLKKYRARESWQIFQATWLAK